MNTHFYGSDQIYLTESKKNSKATDQSYIPKLNTQKWDSSSSLNVARVGWKYQEGSNMKHLKTQRTKPYIELEIAQS